MNNFQKFKRKLTPEQLANWIPCSSCPLHSNECAGFRSLDAMNIANFEPALKICHNKLIEWFNLEASK